MTELASCLFFDGNWSDFIDLLFGMLLSNETKQPVTYLSWFFLLSYLEFFWKMTSELILSAFSATVDMTMGFVF